MLRDLLLTSPAGAAEPLLPGCSTPVGEALAVALLQLLPADAYTLTSSSTSSDNGSSSTAVYVQPLPAVVLLALRDVLCYSRTAKRAVVHSGFHLQLLSSCHLLGEVLKHKGRLPNAEVRVLGAVGESRAAAAAGEQRPRSSKGIIAVAGGKVPGRKRAGWSNIAGGKDGRRKGAGAVDIWQAADVGAFEAAATTAAAAGGIVKDGVGGMAGGSSGVARRIGPGAGGGGGLGSGKKGEQQRQRWRIRPDSSSRNEKGDGAQGLGHGAQGLGRARGEGAGQSTRSVAGEQQKGSVGGAVGAAGSSAAAAAESIEGTAAEGERWKGDVKGPPDQAVVVAGAAGAKGEGVLSKAEAQALMKEVEGKLLLCCMLLRHLVYRDAEVKKELVGNGQVGLLGFVDDL